MHAGDPQSMAAPAVDELASQLRAQLLPELRKGRQGTLEPFVWGFVLAAALAVLIWCACLSFQPWLRHLSMTCGSVAHKHKNIET
jgi:hypothetical protein